MMVNVDMMAKCREKRKKNQMDFISRYGTPCLSFSLNIPGPVKDSPLYREIHETGRFEIQALLSDQIMATQVFQKETGPEAYFAISLSAVELKEIIVNIEDSHALGRIFDMDVIDINGDSISRTDLNLSPRKCLICDERASICARSRRHSVDQLLARIKSIAEAYQSFDKSGS